MTIWRYGQDSAAALLRAARGASQGSDSTHLDGGKAAPTCRALAEARSRTGRMPWSKMPMHGSPTTVWQKESPDRYPGGAKSTQGSPRSNRALRAPGRGLEKARSRERTGLEIASCSIELGDVQSGLPQNRRERPLRKRVASGRDNDDPTTRNVFQVASLLADQGEAILPKDSFYFF